MIYLYIFNKLKNGKKNPLFDSKKIKQGKNKKNVPKIAIKKKRRISGNFKSLLHFFQLLYWKIINQFWHFYYNKYFKNHKKVLCTQKLYILHQLHLHWQFLYNAFLQKASLDFSKSVFCNFFQFRISKRISIFE